jgi:hypothetical protein
MTKQRSAATNSILGRRRIFGAPELPCFEAFVQPA